MHPPHAALDLTSILAGRGRPGVARQAIRAAGARVRVVLDDLHSAHAAGLLPHHQALARGAQDGLALAEAWRGAARVSVLGEPGAVAAASLLTPGGARSLTGPGALASGLAESRGDRLVVLDGPVWVRRMARSIAPAFGGVDIIRGDGSVLSEWTLPGARLWELPAAADPRFGFIGAVSLALLVRAGGDLDAVLDATRLAARACEPAGVFDNAAAQLAIVSALLEEQGFSRLAILSADPASSRWGRFAARAWAAITSGENPDGALRVARGGAPQVIALADECKLQALVDGPRDTWAWLLAPGLAGDAGDLARGLWAAELSLLERARRPVLRWRAGDASAASWAAASWLVVEAALMRAVLDGLEPLAMSAADALRDLQGAEFSDT